MVEKECEKCGFSSEDQRQRLGRILCRVCITFAPDEEDTLREYVNEKVEGSLLFPFRRYALSSVLGLVTDKDTDAQGVQQKKQTRKQLEKPWLNPEEGGQLNPKWADAVRFLANGGLIADIEKKYAISVANKEKLMNESMTIDDTPFPNTEHHESIN